MGDVGDFFLSGMHLSLFLPSSNHGVVGALVCLPRESERSILVCAAGWWAQASLSMKVALITDGNRPSVALGLPRMISCTVYEQLSLRLSHVISCRVPGIGSSIQFLHRLPLLRSSSASPCPLLSHKLKHSRWRDDS
jgi:hypothetical protein